MTANNLLTSSVRCVTSDGLQLSVERTCASSASQARPAVVLQHGLGANGLTFSYPGSSLAQHLAARGFDCFVPELRGAGGSDRPKGPFGLDEYLERDIPAILDAVRLASGHERVSWVGHSMGGILGIFYGMERPDGPIGRLVAIGSALDYSAGKNAFRDLRRARWMAGDWLREIPLGRLARLNGLVAGHGPILPAEKTNFWRGNAEPAVVRHFLAHGFSPISMRLLDDLDTTFSPQGFSRDGGRIQYLPLAKDYRIPTCLLGGSKDPQCTPLALEVTVQLLSGTELEVVRFGKAHGQAEDYGHIDFLVGRRAPDEVWPTITRWLEAGVEGERKTA
jgi:pimeloyl-ACP methyl ester carboxylesterase